MKMEYLVGRELKSFAINTEMCQAFRLIDLAGWNNTSDGDAEAPTGYFSKVTIADNELRELVDAVFDPIDSVTYPLRLLVRSGLFLFALDSDGNKYLFEFHTELDLDKTYEDLQASYGVFLGSDD